MTRRPADADVPLAMMDKAHKSVTFEKITEEYERITKQDILACRSFAARVVNDASFVSIDTKVACLESTY